MPSTAAPGYAWLRLASARSSAEDEELLPPALNRRAAGDGQAGGIASCPTAGAGCKPGAERRTVYLDQILSGGNKQDGLATASMIEAALHHLSASFPDIAW
jgi:hypothetical protein